MPLARVNATDMDLFLITTDEPDRALVESYGLDWHLVSSLQQAWTYICRPDQMFLQADELARQMIKEHTKPLINPTHEKTFLLRTLRTDSHSNRALLFLNEDTAFPWIGVILSANAYQVFQGHIPLHASAVIYRDEIYLFGGPSGAGKSSAARFIVDLGGELLDEDQIILQSKPDGSYTASAWGYSLKTCALPVRAVFQLVQDQENALLPMSRRQAGAFFLQQSDQVAGWMLPDHHYQQLFYKAAELARQIPAYQLHFKLDPGFWSLIQKELNGPHF